MASLTRFGDDVGRKKRRGQRPPAESRADASSNRALTEDPPLRPFDALIGPLIVGSVPSGLLLGGGLILATPADSTAAWIRLGTLAGLIIPAALAAFFMRSSPRRPALHRLGAGVMLGLDLTLVTFGLGLFANRWLDGSPPQTATVEVLSAARTSGNRGGKGRCVLTVDPWRKGDGAREISGERGLCDALQINYRYQRRPDTAGSRFVRIVAHPGALGLEYVSSVTPAPDAASIR